MPRAWQPLPDGRKITYIYTYIYIYIYIKAALRSGSSRITTHSSGQVLKKRCETSPAGQIPAEETRNPELREGCSDIFPP